MREVRRRVGRTAAATRRAKPLYTIVEHLDEGHRSQASARVYSRCTAPFYLKQTVALLGRAALLYLTAAAAVELCRWRLASAQHLWLQQ